MRGPRAHRRAIRLVEDVPGCHRGMRAVAPQERFDHPLQQRRTPGGIAENLGVSSARGAVHTRAHGDQAGVEEHQHEPDAMPLGGGEQHVDVREHRRVEAFGCAVIREADASPPVTEEEDARMLDAITPQPLQSGVEEACGLRVGVQPTVRRRTGRAHVQPVADPGKIRAKEKPVRTERGRRLGHGRRQRSGVEGEPGRGADRNGRARRHGSGVEPSAVPGVADGPGRAPSGPSRIGQRAQTRRLQHFSPSSELGQIGPFEGGDTPRTMQHNQCEKFDPWEGG